jgi:hypothetical protein
MEFCENDVGRRHRLTKSDIGSSTRDLPLGYGSSGLSLCVVRKEQIVSFRIGLVARETRLMVGLVDRLPLMSRPKAQPPVASYFFESFP